MNITFSEVSMPTEGALVVGVLEDQVLTPTAAEVDAQTGGALARAASSGRFTGKKDQLTALIAPPGLEASVVVLAGLGKAAEIDSLRVQSLGGKILAYLNRVGETRAAIAIDALEDCPVTTPEIAARVALGARLNSYRFDKYRTKEKEEDKPTLTDLVVMSAEPDPARAAFEPLDRIADGVFLTRDVVSEPSNVIYPETLAAHAEALAELGVEVDVVGEDRMRALGMHALLGVGQGSARESRLVVMHWNGAPEGSEQQPIAFVGKGVTFDTGGISLKPSSGMEEMKYDMAGAATVIGLMKALAGRKARVNVVGIAGMVENMPSGTAQRPGDVVSSMSGQTIEVIHTDAEGRLVLADALWYTQATLKPRFIIDLATLTGAVIVALGTHHAALFSNDEELAERMLAAGKAEGEPLWRLPLGETYDKEINSDIADVKNVGKGREAGSITAAQFLQRFVNEVTWAHIDIAGVAWVKNDNPIIPKGASGFGVRLLDRLVSENYEAGS